MRNLFLAMFDWLAGGVFIVICMFLANETEQEFTYFQAMVLATLFVIALRVGRKE